MFSRQRRKLSKLSTEVEIWNRPINRSCCCFFNENSTIKTLQDTMCTHAQLLQSCPALCNSMDCTPPGSSVHGLLQARILEWVAFSSCRGYSRPRDQTCVSCTVEPPLSIVFFSIHL